MKHNILLVDDEADYRKSMKDFLEQEGFFVMTVASGDEALALVRQRTVQFTLALVDYKMPDLNGSTLIRRIREIDDQLILIGLSGVDSSDDTHNENLASGALMFVQKDAGNMKLLGILHRVCREVERREKVMTTMPKNQRSELISSVNMVGVSEHLAHVAQIILKLRSSGDGILIRGEPGTGKEMVARAVHMQSLRAKGPFVPVNCGAIPKDLVESELFGHEKGAFTGAMTAQIGKFQAANGGTIFLDEIGEMPLSLQVTLLRVLQEREITPVGSNATKKIDVRVVAATNAPLEKMIEAGAFRQDLYYRLNALPISLRPLRDRPEDIPPLVEFFLKSANDSSGDRKEILDSCVRRLQALSWPGNVRELGHTLQRMHIMEDGPTITEETFERATQFQDGRTFAPPNADIPLDYEIWRVKTNQEERKLIQKSLRMAFNLKDAATRLAISRSHLRSRMRALGIENPFSEREET